MTPGRGGHLGQGRSEVQQLIASLGRASEVLMNDTSTIDSLRERMAERIRRGEFALHRSNLRGYLFLYYTGAAHAHRLLLEEEYLRVLTPETRLSLEGHLETDLGVLHQHAVLHADEMVDNATLPTDEALGVLRAGAADLFDVHMAQD